MDIISLQVPLATLELSSNKTACYKMTAANFPDNNLFELLLWCLCSGIVLGNVSRITNITSRNVRNTANWKI